MPVRVTATIPKEQVRVLKALANKHKVSMAWLVRFAISRLVDEAESLQLPLDLPRRS